LNDNNEDGKETKNRVFNYWGSPESNSKQSGNTVVWGDPVKGIDITGNAFNGRNGDGNDKNGHHGYRTKMGDAFVHTSSKEGLHYTCDFKKNFISGQRYSQISLTDYCKNGVCNANPKYGGANSKDNAIAYCKKTCHSRSGCTGFFFQTHGNGHEICGFYTGTVNKDAAQWHGHKNGAICFHNEKIQLSNCEGLHSSAKNTNHCLIGGKCGPCPIQTKFPTPAPTPAPTVPVPHKCMRTGRRGKVLNPVAFGWAGVGADQKYCFLEHCKMCNNPKTYKGHGKERFCPMRAHQDATPDTGADTEDSPVRSGVCGKHEFSDKCEFVSCTYSEKQGMKVTVVQGDRGLGLFANNGKFLTGDQHECRANKNNKANRFDCECKCQTTKK
jgi:hypothetical protein